ncbi:MAG: PIN domain-containing protein [Fibrobacter sp.]|nr:PIN domain-containing protein [Fibrobacter sp.]
MNVERVFLDTNILVYGVDENNPEKQIVARNIINELSSLRRGFVSTQVLQEFYNVLAKKMKCPRHRAKAFVELVANSLHVHCNSVGDILKAIDISNKNQFSFWDSLILSSAMAEGCTVLLTEDLNAGQIVNEMAIINPFA